jgi:hypothetical protein
MPESIELRDYGRLLKDGELRIKAHDDQKIRVRYVVACDFVLYLYSESCLFYIFVVDSCVPILFRYCLLSANKWKCFFYICFRYVFIFDQVMLMCKSMRVSLFVSLAVLGTIG